ncbi:hypothetical protein WEB32_34290 [Streptomyces netropsis]|uniref:hypothetical protein n=1 Tax=Streptomyces netropsis TaxID=55404 RepID=UPI0030CE6054
MRQADAFGLPALQGVAQDRPGLVEGLAAGVVGDLHRPSIPADRQRRQALTRPLVVIGDEALHVIRGEHHRVVAAAGRDCGQEHAELDARPASALDVLRASRRLRRAQPAGHSLPEQITQPPLRHVGEVEVAGASFVADAVVLGLQEARLLGLLLGDVDDPQFVRGLLEDPAFVLGERRRVGQQVEDGVHAAQAGQVRHRLDVPQRQGRALGLLGMRQQPEADLGLDQRRKAEKIDRAGARGRTGGATPVPERIRVGAGDLDGLAPDDPVPPPVVGLHRADRHCDSARHGRSTAAEDCPPGRRRQPPGSRRTREAPRSAAPRTPHR